MVSFNTGSFPSYYSYKESDLRSFFTDIHARFQQVTIEEKNKGISYFKTLMPSEINDLAKKNVFSIDFNVEVGKEIPLNYWLENLPPEKGRVLLKGCFECENAGAPFFFWTISAVHNMAMKASDCSPEIICLIRQIHSSILEKRAESAFFFHLQEEVLSKRSCLASWAFFLDVLAKYPYFPEIQ